MLFGGEINPVSLVVFKCRCGVLKIYLNYYLHRWSCLHVICNTFYFKIWMEYRRYRFWETHYLFFKTCYCHPILLIQLPYLFVFYMLWKKCRKKSWSTAWIEFRSLIIYCLRPLVLCSYFCKFCFIIWMEYRRGRFWGTHYLFFKTC